MSLISRSKYRITVIQMLILRYKAALDNATTHKVADCKISAPDLITENMADLVAPLFLIEIRNPQIFGASCRM